MHVLGFVLGLNGIKLFPVGAGVGTLKIPEYLPRYFVGAVVVAAAAHYGCCQQANAQVKLYLIYNLKLWSLQLQRSGYGMRYATQP